MELVLSCYVFFRGVHLISPYCMSKGAKNEVFFWNFSPRKGVIFRRYFQIFEYLREMETVFTTISTVQSGAQMSWLHEEKNAAIRSCDTVPLMKTLSPY